MASTVVLPKVTSILFHHGKTLQDYHLSAEYVQVPSEDPPATVDEKAISNQMKGQLNQEQQQAANLIISCNIRVQQ